MNNMTLFQLIDWNISLEMIEEKVRKNHYTPCNTIQMTSVGWFTPEMDTLFYNENHSLVVEKSGMFLLKLRIEKKILPGKVIKEKQKEALELRLTSTTDRRDSVQIEHDVKDELVRTAHTHSVFIDINIDVQEGLLIVGTVNKTDVESCVLFLKKTFDVDFQFERLNNASNYVSHQLTEWVNEESVPTNVDVQSNCCLESELLGGGDKKAKITCRDAAHNQVGDIIRNGYKVKQLSLRYCVSTTQDKSFIFDITQNFTFNKITISEQLKFEIDDSGDVFVLPLQIRRVAVGMIEGVGGMDKLVPQTRIEFNIQT